MPGQKLNFGSVFSTVSAIHSFLNKDTHLALVNFHDAVLAFNNGVTTDGSKVGFFAKALIRAFLGHVDGVGYALRRAVLKNADAAGLSLTPRQQAELMERKYDATTGSITKEEKLSSTESSIKDGIKYFARLFGSDFTINTSGEEWRGFKRLVKIRNRFSHPDYLEDLSPRLAMQAIQPTVVWFIGQVRDMLIDISAKQGSSEVFEVGPSQEHGFKESENPLEDIFSAEDHEAIEAVGGRSLEYVKLMFTLSAADTSHALHLISANMSRVYTHPYQYAVRNATRTLFADVEATIGAASFFINAAAKRGEITLSEEDKMEMKEGEVEDKFIAILNIWSREFGDGGTRHGSGEGWKQFRGARFFRDRLTHPKDVPSLRVDASIERKFLNAASFASDSRSALYIDPDRWASMAASMDREVAEKEARQEVENEDLEE